MRVSVSILALSLTGITTNAHADENTWFRLGISAPIFISDGSSEGNPDDDLEIVVASEVDERIYGNLNIPVTVTGIDSTYSVQVTGLPAGANWTPDGEVHGKGSIAWTSAGVGSYPMSVEVRDATGTLVGYQDVDLTVYPELEMSAMQATYQAMVGENLTIAPNVENTIGDLAWGSTPATFPEWLDFDTVTGTIEVDTTNSNTINDIILSATDQADWMSVSTDPFSIIVNGVPTSYWVSTLGGPASEQGYGVAAGSDGSVYVTGNTTGASPSDLLVAKFNPDGSLAWTRTLGAEWNDAGRGIAIDSSDSVYVVGHSSNTGAGSRGMLIAKYSSAGALIWKNTFGGPGSEEGWGIDVSAGAVYVTGKNGFGSLQVTKLSADDGSLDWQKRLGQNSTHGDGIAVGLDGIYITGNTRDGGKGASDFLIAKYSTEGNLVWRKLLGNEFADNGRDVAVGPDGSVYVVGDTQGYYGTESGSADVVLAKYSSSWTLEWKRTLGAGGSTGEFGDGIAVAGDSIYVTGKAGLGVLIAKYSTSGILEDLRTLGSPSSEWGKDIDIGFDGSIYVTGNTKVHGSYDLLVARLPSESEGPMTAGPFTLDEHSLAVTMDPSYLLETTITWSSPDTDFVMPDASAVQEDTDPAEMTSTFVELQTTP